MNIFIVEDNASHLKLLKAKVMSLGYQIVGTSQTIQQVMPAIQKVQPDIVLIDINIQGDNDGIQLAIDIKENTDASVLFITSQSESDIISEAVAAKPDGYLVKPVDPINLKANIELALFKKAQNPKTLNEPEVKIGEEFLTVRTGEKLQVLQFKDIKLIKVDTKNYVTIMDVNNKPFVIRDSLKHVINNILPDGFIRTHSSYGVNVDYILFIDERQQMVHLKTDDTVPIGKSFKKELYEKMNIKS
ncbi:MAG: DNA-binding LytR/AlgR family response regulator [Crocinitomix sp.]|jgi:DNA-binding LytR/AlgR family response regulator